MRSGIALSPHRRRSARLVRVVLRVESLEDRSLLSAGLDGMWPLANPSAGNSVLVQFADGADAQKVQGLLNTLSAYVDGEYSSGTNLVILGQGITADAGAASLQSSPLVVYAEANRDLESTAIRKNAVSNDTYYSNGSMWNMYGDQTAKVNVFGSQAGEAWAAGKTGSSSVYVGIIDEGFQFDHPDLAGQVWTNPFDPVDGKDNDGNGFVDDVHGWDFANSDNTIYDGGATGSQDNHGTHVAGTIGARGGNGSGVAGINWNVTMISGKFLGSNGGTLANAVRAIDYFTDLKIRHGLNIVATNNSWGGGGFSQAMLNAITRAAQQNILFIAAAGNGGADGRGDNNDLVPSYPSNYNTTAGAGYDAVIAVAAITSSGAKASFSNFGAKTVDIAAPGQGIWSTVANGYSSYSGTSMATPHVTGAAALYASLHPNSTARQIRDAILRNAIPTASMARKSVTGGRLDVSRF